MLIDDRCFPSGVSLIILLLEIYILLVNGVSPNFGASLSAQIRSCSVFIYTYAKEYIKIPIIDMSISLPESF